jgi:hypothetical protein
MLTQYMRLTYFQKTKAPLNAKKPNLFGNLKGENNRIGRHLSDSRIRLTQKRKSEVNYIYNVCIYYDV